VVPGEAAPLDSPLEQICVSASVNLDSLLARSDSLNEAWAATLAPVLPEGSDEVPLQAGLVIDACTLTLEHGRALRTLVSIQLEASALALLRAQHEALLRATWICFAASDSEVQTLGAPQTMDTLKRANGLPMSAVLLERVEKSDAPAEVKRGLREFRTQGWAAANSYAHAGLLPLGRVAKGHPYELLVQAVQVSNAHSYAASMLLAGVLDPSRVQVEVNLAAVAYPDCMMRA
jgi:hypothetical protein